MVKLSASGVPYEQYESEEFARWLALNGYRFTHVPNETGSSSEAKKRATKMKRAGVSPGFPDFIIFGKNGINFIVEMKRVKGGYTGKNQRDWLKFLGDFGFECRVCRGHLEAIEFIRENDKGIVHEAYENLVGYSLEDSGDEDF